ncbi:hypothetical protein EII17_01100 [Clostridiales bacterium COT073_COT-073]|nr:hypothetical protein EII17_01100 [Clostridiales bacterium COT073_COT-073]
MRNYFAIVQKALYSTIRLSAGEDEFTFFNIRSLSVSEIVFYIGVLIICAGAIAYLVWWTLKKRRDFFKNPDIKVETIKLHVRSEDERKKDEKYEKEVEKFLEKKRYIKGRK